MANKKTVKAAEVQTIDQLVEQLAAKRKDLLDAKRGNAAGELTNPRVIGSTRKEIARLLTAKRKAELTKVTEDK